LQCLSIMIRSASKNAARPAPLCLRKRRIKTGSLEAM
jgi:hypothetical protein